jgi:uncharacterized repeat protein (TIGR03803 family)
LEYKPDVQANEPGELTEMRNQKSSCGVAILAVLVVVCATTGALAQESTIFQFDNKDGFDPLAGLVSDSAGNLYGTTFYGGDFQSGTAFKLTPNNGSWTETVLYNFNGTGIEPFWPNTRLAIDASGNLYGTTFFGGGYEVGSVFMLSPTTSGQWREKTLHSFQPQTNDGTYPHGGVMVDAAGNVYGTTGGGGKYGDGIVYELVPNGSGGFSEKVLHAFQGTDGATPHASLIMDNSGNLYGTTVSGGNSSACQDGCGTVYQLIPKTNGSWVENVLWNFNGTDGENPYGALVFDASGNLYGTASQGAADGAGAVFELSPTTGGGWSEQTLHTFNPADGDANNSWATLVFDAAGNMYGTSLQGGASGRGAVFEMTPGSSGWSESILYSFSINRPDGWDPAGQLVIDAAGNLYGATLSGGDYSCDDGCGILFEITP